MGKIEYHLTESQEKQGKFHGKKGIYAPRKVRQLANYFFKSSEQIKWSIKRKERKKSHRMSNTKQRRIFEEHCADLIFLRD